MSPQGQVLSAHVAGRVVMKSYLSGKKVSSDQPNYQANAHTSPILTRTHHTPSIPFQIHQKLPFVCG